MRNHGTIMVLDVEDNRKFSQAVEQGAEAAARTMKCGVGVVTVDVKFLTCSRYGDVYMVHYASPFSEACAVRLTQLSVLLEDGRPIPLGTP